MKNNNCKSPYETGQILNGVKGANGNTLGVSVNGEVIELDMSTRSEPVASLIKESANKSVMNMDMERPLQEPDLVINTKHLKPFGPAMETALKKVGENAPSNITDLAYQFYNKIVVPTNNSVKGNELASVNFYDSFGHNRQHVDESVSDAILTFFGSLGNRVNQGEELPPVLAFLGNTANNLANKIGIAAENTAASKIGHFFIKNWILVLVVLAIVIYFLVTKK